MQVLDFTPEEVQDIICQRETPLHAGSIIPTPPPQQLQPNLPAAAAVLAQLYGALSNPAAGQLAGGRLTLREVMKVLRRQAVLGLPLHLAAVSLLASRVQHSTEAAKQLEQLFRGLGGDFTSVEVPRPEQYALEVLPLGGARFHAGPGCWVDVPGACLSRSSVTADPAQVPAVLRMGLVQMAFAAAAGEPVLLLGPTGCKSTLVSVWADIMGRKEDLSTVHLSPGEGAGAWVLLLWGPCHCNCPQGRCVMSAFASRTCVAAC
jgi:hypothetical protein